MTDYRARSLWLDGVPGELTPRPSLPGPTDVDVAIVGAGFTGLWTAYYLKKADPHLRVAVLEREIAGFGASGRNGGWCHTTFPGSRELAAQDARPAGRRSTSSARCSPTVYEIARVVDEEGIDARFHHGGQLDLATTPVQLLRLREAVEYERSWGFGEDDYVAARRRGDARAHQGGRVPRRRLHAARRRRRPGPPRARARRRRRAAGGAHLRAHPRHPPRAARRDHARAATCAPTSSCAPPRRSRPSCPATSATLVPIYSLMIGTEPLPDELLGRGRVGRPRGVRRLPLPHLLRHAHRGRPHRHRRARRPVPLRLAARASASSATLPSATTCARCSASSSPRSATSRVTHHWGGADRGAARLVHLGRPGPRHRHGLGGRLRRRRRVDDQPRRPHPARPDPRAASPSSRGCRGSTTAPSSGSPSRCAGWASTRRSRRWAAPTTRRRGPAGRAGARPTSRSSSAPEPAAGAARRHGAVYVLPSERLTARVYAVPAPGV